MRPRWTQLLLGLIVTSALNLLTVSVPVARAGSPPAAEPDLGPNVLIFDPAMPGIQEKIDAIFAGQEKSQFGAERYAYLFKPGKYALDVQVGFYMHVAGLGRSPDDVEITGAVRSKAAWMRGNATCNFWRCAENLSVIPTRDGKVNVWAVSQGVALRRTHIKGDLNLSDNGWSSGGIPRFSTISSAGLAARRRERRVASSPSTAATSWATTSGSGAPTTAPAPSGT